VHDVAIQNLPVTFALDRGGLVGADGATHHGAFDLSYLRCIPNMVVMTPSDENECRRMLSAAFLHDGPAAVRYPRGVGAGVAVERSLEGVPIGRGEIRRHSRAPRGARIAILAFGPVLHPALRAAESLDATVVNMRFVKPLDTELLAQVAGSHDAMVTVEENVVMGGAGSACAEALAGLAIERPFLHLGLPDRFIDHGDPAGLLAAAGLDAAGLERAVLDRFGALLRETRRVKSIA